MNSHQYTCPVCLSDASLLDVVDFHKSCEEQRGKFLPLSGLPIYYVMCDACLFCWSPTMYEWPVSRFAESVYNDTYAEVDPDYLKVRPAANAQGLLKMFPLLPESVRHLDYGGGNGVLSDILQKTGWRSQSYDPFVHGEPIYERWGLFQLMTAFEVFEHVPDVQDLMKNISAMLDPQGMILFSTLISDGKLLRNQRIGWWYAGPRNGHISLFSKKSLALLAQQYGFNLVSFNSGFHAMFKTLPEWAAHLIKTGN